MLLLTYFNGSEITISCYKTENCSMNRMNYLLNEKNKTLTL
jgi:hypothetical protein